MPLLGVPLASGNSRFARQHGGREERKLQADAGLLLHGQTDEQRAERDAERQQSAELKQQLAAQLRLDPEALAAKWRSVAESATALADGLLADAPPGEESVPEWMSRRFQELGIKLPSVTVTYQGLSVETDAAVGAAGIPTVARFLGGDLLAAAQRALAGSDAASRSVRLPVLRDVQGVLKPGRLTLLLGPPSSGKSMLMKTIAGQMEPSAALRMGGEVRYNGQLPSEFDLQRTAAYVDQYDVHLPLLTVRETLAFARDALWAAGAKNDLAPEFHQVLDAEASEVGSTVLPPELRGDLVRLVTSPEFMVEFTLRLLGLQGCADTVVGDAMIRGISGGQKRRLTCGELLVGGRELLLLDEISTGLDSATTFTVVKYLGDLARTMRCTTVVSLLQPSGDVLALFDDVMLLADGRMLYHGPVEAVLPWFASLGFACPPRQEVPAFLQSLTSASGQRALAAPAMLADAQKRHVASSQLVLPLEDMEAAFWGADKGPGGDMRAALEATRAPEAFAGQPRALVQPEDVAPWWTFFLLCARRQFKLLGRDTELLQGRLMQVVLAGFIVGTLFLQIPVDMETGATKFIGVCFMSVAMLAFISLPLTGSVFAHKPTFLKQRSLRMFPPTAYGASMLAQEVPLMVACAIIFSVMVYWMAGFAPLAGSFFMYTALLLLSGLVFGAMFIVLAALCPTLQVAGGLSGVIILLLILLSGYAIVRPAIPGWWIWGFWINPMSWGFRAVTTNEFLRSRWDFTAVNGMRVGDEVLSSFGMYTEYKWVWAGLAFMAGTYLLFGATVCAAFAITPAARKVATVGEDEGQAAAVKKSSKSAAAAEAGAASPDAVGMAELAAAADGKPDAVDEADGKGPSAALDIPFTPMALAFRNINYYVNKPSWSKAPESEKHPGMIQLLHGLSGVIRPGQLTCLMGASGAGKTTLLDVLAGRKTQGVIEGDITLNGHPKQDDVWRRVSAYVEQTDIHTETATVREALLFSARLRLPATVSDADISHYVDSVLELVELQGLRNSIVGAGAGAGGGADAGLSLEQRKRLSLAVELVANPAVIFMDEPTSGLDGHAAAVVMRVTRSVASMQRTIVCTIHQPSAEIFFQFDMLVLLQTGGRMMYCGPLGHESADLIAYFSAAGVRPIQAGENPANYMLDVAGGSAAGTSSGPDFVELYKTSELLAANTKAVDEACQPSGEPPSVTGGTYAATYWVQLQQLLGRQMTRYWRMPQYNGIRFVVSLAFALVVGSLYYKKGQVSAGAPFTAVVNVMGLLFMSLSNLGSINIQSVLIVAAQERTVLYRERAAGMYSALCYVTAAAIVELPYLVLQVLLFSLVSYWMIGFKSTAGAFFFFLLVFFLSLLIFTFFGQMCLYVMPNVQAAQALSATLAAIFDVLNGFFIPRNLMPGWWRWAWYINPVSWMATAVASNQLAGDETEIVDSNGSITTVSAFLDSGYGYYPGLAWPAIGILIGFVALFRITSTLAVQYLSFQSR